MRLRKYCKVHDSLWRYDRTCEYFALEAENVPDNELECQFVVVDIVFKPEWMRI